MKKNKKIESLIEDLENSLDSLALTRYDRDSFNFILCDLKEELGII